MKNDNISSRQMIIILMVFRVTLALSYFNSLDFPPANQDNWSIILFSFFYIMLFSIPFLFLTNKFNDLDMLEYFSIVLGKWVGKVVTIIYGIYFLIYTIYLIVLEAQLVGINILPNTASWVVIATLLMTSIYIISKDLVIIYWSGELISSIALVGILALLFLGFQNMDTQALFPILKDSTLGQINRGSFLSSLIFVDIFALTMGAKFLEDKKQINKIYIKSMLYAIVLIAAILILIQTSMGVEQAKRAIYPFLSYTRLIKYKSILERIDIIYVISWLSIHTGKISIYLLFSLMCFKENYKIKEDKLITLVLTTIVGLVSNFVANKRVMGIQVHILESLLYIAFVFTTIIPALVCIVYFFRRKTLQGYIEKDIREEKQL